MLPHRTPPGPHAADHNHLHPRLPSIRQLHPYLPPMAQTAAPPQPQPDHPHVPTSDADRADEHEHNDNDGQPPKKRRFRQPLSCTGVVQASQDPVRQEPAVHTVRASRRPGKVPVNEKYVFRAEHDALRARVDALDALVHGHQVPSPSLPLSHPHSHPHPLPPTFRPFTSHSSTSTTATPTKAQHPDHLYQALRTHSPRSSPVTHEARISPTEALTRISPVGARNEERTRDTAARPKNRSAQACHSQGARLRARGEPWAARLCRPLRTRYLRTLRFVPCFVRVSWRKRRRREGNGGGREGRDAREQGRDEHGTFRVDVNMHPSPPLSSPVYAHHHAQEAYAHGQDLECVPALCALEKGFSKEKANARKPTQFLARDVSPASSDPTLLPFVLALYRDFPEYPEKIGGCPNVSLPDSPLEMTVFLEAILDYNEHRCKFRDPLLPFQLIPAWASASVGSGSASTSFSSGSASAFGTSSTTSFTSISLGNTTATPTNAPPDSPPDSLLLFQTSLCAAVTVRLSRRETLTAGRAAKHRPRRRRIARETTPETRQPASHGPKWLSRTRPGYLLDTFTTSRSGDVKLARPKCSSLEALPAPYH
ncbi:hypothetical protein B0H10DRAFT_2228402 [Mycena sp. CBHHK59/15]|nr:hypothetical protein B0H10DRAFT_2228402 [Mycena sp. CBHHK59/15]